MPKKRIDLILTEKGFYDSRQKARSAIMAGLVKAGDKVIDKPGTLVDESLVISLAKSESEKFVSRGGLKLEKAIEVFKPDITGKVFLDIGASTGGFTDCLLKHGSKYVYAVDVGYGQFDWSLRQDSRVKVVERCNARYLKREELYDNPELIGEAAVIDVSFISLSKIIPNLLTLLNPGFYIIALIKPQFEAGRDKVKKGIVTNPDIHKEVILAVNSFLESIGLSLYGLTYSPVKGPSGNMEFLAYIREEKPEHAVDISKLVEEAHTHLNSKEVLS